MAILILVNKSNTCKMASVKPKRKPKPKKLVLKFTDKEFQFLKKCAAYQKTTVNKFLKDAIKDRSQPLKSKIKEMEQEARLKKQLNLFESIEVDGYEQKQVQTSMIEEYKEFYK